MISIFDDTAKSSNKNQNCALLTEKKYAEYIQKINSLKSGAKKKVQVITIYAATLRYTQSRWSRQLICPVAVVGSKKYYVTTNELFDIQYGTHMSCGHGERDGICHEFHQLYKNITQGHIKIFLQLCKACGQKKSDIKKGVVAKPLFCDV